MHVAGPARDNVPMQVGNLITEFGQIDLGGFQCIAQCLLHYPYGPHQALAGVRVELGHFSDVGVPDDTCVSGVARDVGVYDAQFSVAPEAGGVGAKRAGGCGLHRSEEHTSELQSLMRISYAVFLLKKKKTITI